MMNVCQEGDGEAEGYRRRGVTGLWWTRGHSRDRAGVIKEVMGFRRFHLRGLAAVKGEWTLVCMAWNVKRLHVIGA